MQWKVDFILTTSNDQLSGWPEKKFQKKAPKKSRLLFGGLLPIWSTTVFWIWQNHYIWEVHSVNGWDALKNSNACSWRWSTERVQFLSMTMLNCISHDQWFKSWRNWATKFWFIRHIHLTSCQSTRLPLQASWQFSAGKTFTQPARCRKRFPRVCQILKHGFLCYRSKQTYFSLAKKNVVIVMVPILINKDVFEPSYNDLKFMVENCNYVCINLIISDSYLCQCCRL